MIVEVRSMNKGHMLFCFEKRNKNGFHIFVLAHSLSAVLSKSMICLEFNQVITISDKIAQV